MLSFWRFYIYCLVLILIHLFITPSSIAFQSQVGSWTHVGSIPVSSVADIVIDPTDDKVIYAVDWNNTGLFKSISGGEQWSLINSTTRFTRLAIAPSNPQVIYGGNSPRGREGPVGKSVDGGATWVDVTANLPAGSGSSYPWVNSILVDVNDPDSVIIGLTGNCTQVWKTTDGGLSWIWTGGPGCDSEALAVAPSDANMIYWGGRNAGAGTYVAKSIDKASSWIYPTNLPYDNLFGYTITAIAIDPVEANIIYAGACNGCGGVYRSLDSGNTWTMVSHIGVDRNLIADPARPNTIYFANPRLSRGVYSSIDSGASIVDISGNLPIVSISKLLIPESNPDLLYASTQNALYVYGLMKSNQSPIADANGPYSVEEGGVIVLTGSGLDPENGTLTYKWDLDNNGDFETDEQSPLFSAVNIDGPSVQTVVLKVCDNNLACSTDQAIISIYNASPKIGKITVPINSIPVNTSMIISASFIDSGVLDTHTATLYYGDGLTAVDGAVVEENGSGTVSGVHTYSTAGIYKITLIVKDNQGAVDIETATINVHDVPKNKEQCKKGGWMTYQSLNFKNQGDCVSYIATQGTNPPSIK